MSQIELHGSYNPIHFVANMVGETKVALLIFGMSDIISVDNALVFIEGDFENTIMVCLEDDINWIPLGAMMGI